MQDPAPFEVDTTVTDRAALIMVRGELDIATAPRLRREFSRCMQRTLTSLTIDFSGVTFCDCAGLGALLAARKWAVSAGVRFHLANPSRQVAKLLADTGTSRLFREARRPVRPPMTVLPTAGPERVGRQPSEKDGYRATGMSA
jgi:anti-anti-sigma factor